MRVAFVSVFGVLCIALSHISGASVKDIIRCMCTTIDCLQEGRVSCEAEFFCYVQMTPNLSPTRSGDSGQQIIRGCIDSKNPLLCENRKPDWYSGPWPVLHCCSADWCNGLTVPTLPTWAKSVQDEDIFAHDIRSFTADSSSYYDQEEVHSAPVDPRDHHHINVKVTDPETSVLDPGHRNSVPTINPYVFVVLPIVGACAVAVLVAISVLILRRRYATVSQNSLVPDWKVYDHTCCTSDTCRAVLVNDDTATWRMKMHLDCGRTSGSECQLLDLNAVSSCK